MNDSFSNQNSVAFYQAPAAPATPVDPMMPATNPTDPGMGGQNNDQVQDMNQSTQSQSPVQDQEPIVPEHSDAVVDQDVMAYNPPVAAVSGSEDDTSAIPDPSPTPSPSSAPQIDQVQSQPQQPVAETNAQLGSTKPTPEEIVKRLADRIKAYEARANEQKTDAAEQHLGEVDSVAAAAPLAAPSVMPTDDSKPVVSDAPLNEVETESKEESLEAQNIFELLGVMDGTDAEKDAFLDQLQQVIWEDFLESDVQLLLTKSESEELQTILSQEGKSDADRQELAVTFLEKLVPDLENIMLEKALDLKKEMVFERIAGLRDLYSGRPEVLVKLNEIEITFKQDKWHTGAVLLNALK